MNKKFSHKPLQLAVHAAGVIPLVHIGIGLLTNNLTYNPIQKVEQITGLAGLVFLVLSLACTPLSNLMGWRQLTLRRKALGLYGFLYAALHIAVFVAVDYGLNLTAILNEAAGKDYFITGGLAFLALLPLAATSFTYWMKKLGKNWKRLHRLVYIVTPLVVFHYIFVVKGDITRLQGNLVRPLEYGLIVTVLLVFRIPPVRRKVIAARMQIQTAIRTSYSHVRTVLLQSR
jgi:methionine sulfoxide reductase heme-binding subunit